MERMGGKEVNRKKSEQSDFFFCLIGGHTSRVLRLLVSP